MDKNVTKAELLGAAMSLLKQQGRIIPVNNTEETPEVEEMHCLTRYADISRVPECVFDYYDTKAEKGRMTLVIAALYNYGYIMGQRAERAKKK